MAHALTVLEPRFPGVAAKLNAAEADVLAYLDFPVDRWRSISSTNAIERVNAELDRRAKVVGIFRNTASLVRLFTAVLQDQHDEWQDAGVTSASSPWRGGCTPRVHPYSPTRSPGASPPNSPTL